MDGGVGGICPVSSKLKVGSKGLSEEFSFKEKRLFWNRLVEVKERKLKK